MLLSGGSLVDFDGFLAVLRCIENMAGFLGEDFEEAQVNSLDSSGQ